MTVDTGAYRAIAHPIRRSILDALTSGDRSVTELCAMFDVSQPAVSQHLEVLRDSGLVAATKVGRLRRYALDPTPLREIVEWTARYERFWTDRFDRLGRVLDREARPR